MSLATALLTLSLLAAHPAAYGASSAPEMTPRVAFVVPPMAFVAIDTDTDLPFKEYGLPDRSNEGEQEEKDGDGDDAESIDANFGPPTCDRPMPTGFGVMVANRWFLGSGPVARLPYLRC